MKLESVINRCIQNVYSAPSLDQAKFHMNEMLDQCKIKREMRSKMRIEIGEIKSLNKLQFYATNAMLKFEGLGVGSYKD
jgi:hypothetical protein